MHTQTLTVVRIIEIARCSDKGMAFPKRTELSFEHDGGRAFGVVIPGWPQIEEGARFVCALEQPDNWQTLIGWKNLTTGEIAAPDTGRPLWVITTALASALLMLFMTAWNIDLLWQDTPGWLLAFPPALAIAGSLRWRAVRRQRAFIERLPGA